jgi:hypothetical protein
MSNLDENATTELNEICEAVLRYHTSAILGNTLPGSSADADMNQLPRPTVEQLKNLSIQLGLPWTLVRRTFKEMRETYAEVLREGIAELQRSGTQAS